MNAYMQRKPYDDLKPLVNAYFERFPVLFEVRLGAPCLADFASMGKGSGLSRSELSDSGYVHRRPGVCSMCCCAVGCVQGLLGTAITPRHPQMRGAKGREGVYETLTSAVQMMRFKQRVRGVETLVEEWV